MSDLMLIYALFPSAGEALDCCRTLLDERLIACANRLPPIISHYRWEGELQTVEEHPVLLKTSAARQAEAMARIAELHQYKLPAIMSWAAGAAHPAFAAWVGEETGG